MPAAPSDDTTNTPPRQVPAPGKTAIRQAFFEAPTRNKAAFDKLTDGKSPGFAPAAHSDYQVTIELQKFVDSLRRRSGS